MAKTSTAASADVQVEGDAMPMEKQEVAAKEVNKDEECVFEVRAKKYKSVDGEWKDLGVGVARLMRHLTDKKKKRLVMRNSVGKVSLNFAIGVGMQFEKVTAGKKGSFVRFLAKESPDNDEAEKFMLKVKPDHLDKLYETLTSFASA